MPNSSSNAITSSTVSRLSAPRSSMKDAPSTTLASSTPRCSTTIFLTRSAMSLISKFLIRLRQVVPDIGGSRSGSDVLPRGALKPRDVNAANQAAVAAVINSAPPITQSAQLANDLLFSMRGSSVHPSLQHGHATVHMQGCACNITCFR